MRGQAFDTMMLVISVIVAIAILGILTGILGGVNPEVNDPKALMKSTLSKIYSAGFGVSDAKEVNFKKDSVILKEEVIGNTAMNKNELNFVCASSSTICGPGKAIVTSGNKIEVNSDTKANIVACGNDARSKYCIAIGRQPKEAKDACMTTCELG